MKNNKSREKTRKWFNNGKKQEIVREWYSKEIERTQAYIKNVLLCKKATKGTSNRYRRFIQSRKQKLRRLGRVKK